MFALKLMKIGQLGDYIMKRFHDSSQHNEHCALNHRHRTLLGTYEIRDSQSSIRHTNQVLRVNEVRNAM